MVLWELQVSLLGGPLLYEQQFVSEASLASLLAATVVRWTRAKLR